jgi:transcriptional regulator with XRE-family HTH domain
MKKPIPKQIADLVQARHNAGLSQSDVAKILGVSVPSVSQFECCRRDPSLGTMLRYAGAVNAIIKIEPGVAK